MTHDPVPTGPVDLPPQGFVPNTEQQQILYDTLIESGVIPGHYDMRILRWVGDWDWSTVATITSWIARAAAARDTAHPGDSDGPTEAAR